VVDWPVCQLPIACGDRRQSACLSSSGAIIPGAKNITGGRLYLNPIRKLLPDIIEQAPLERFVTKERILMMSDKSSVAIRTIQSKIRAKTLSQLHCAEG